jgi:hypothetical protein
MSLPEYSLLAHPETTLSAFGRIIPIIRLSFNHNHPKHVAILQHSLYPETMCSQKAMSADFGTPCRALLITIEGIIIHITVAS